MHISWDIVFISKMLLYFLGQSVGYGMGVFLHLAEPWLGIRHLLYLGYALHHYVIIMQVEGILNHLKTTSGFLVYLIFALIVTCATNSDKMLPFIFDNPGEIYVNVTSLVLRTATCVATAIIGINLYKSIFDTLEASKKFLESLTPTAHLEKRIVSIVRIQRYNFILLLLQVSSPAVKELAAIVELVVMVCASCDKHVFYILEHALIEPFQDLLPCLNSVVFALIHIVYLKSFRSSCLCCRNNQGEN